MQIIFARRDREAASEEGPSELESGNAGVAEVLSFKLTSISLGSTGKCGLSPAENLYCVASRRLTISRSSRPSIARGKSMALNSAPTRMTSEIMYIHTRRAIPAPREP